MKCFSFSKRNIKELIRDPLTIVFGIAFPLVLLGLLTLIQSHIPAELFTINKLAPGMTVFALSFFSLFSGLLLAKDRTDAFLIRLYSRLYSPLYSLRAFAKRDLLSVFRNFGLKAFG